MHIPILKTVQYCKNIWNIVQDTQGLTLPLTGVTVKQLIGILKYEMTKNLRKK